MLIFFGLRPVDILAPGPMPCVLALVSAIAAVAATSGQWSDEANVHVGVGQGLGLGVAVAVGETFESNEKNFHIIKAHSSP